MPSAAVATPAPPKTILTQLLLATALKRSVPTIIRWTKLGMPVLGSGRGVRPLFDFDAVLAWLADGHRPGNGGSVKRGRQKCLQATRRRRRMGREPKE